MGSKDSLINSSVNIYLTCFDRRMNTDINLGSHWTNLAKWSLLRLNLTLTF